MFEDLISLEMNLPLQALAQSTLGPIKVGPLQYSYSTSRLSDDSPP
jgi:hypothetical protein